MMKLTLVDRYGDVTEIYLDRSKPELVDEYGSPVIDMETHPFRQEYTPNRQDQTAVKDVLDAFLMFPSPGLSCPWMNGDVSVMTKEMLPFAEALLFLTGKVLVRIDK